MTYGWTQILHLRKSIKEKKKDKHQQSQKPCSFKDIFKRMKDRPKKDQKYFQNTYLTKNLSPEYKHVSKCNSKNQSIKGKRLAQIFYQRRLREIKHMKKCENQNHQENVN